MADQWLFVNIAFASAEQYQAMAPRSSLVDRNSSQGFSTSENDGL